MFKLKLLLIPLATRNVVYLTETYTDVSRIGYLEIFLFGLRIARIQQTKPWS